MPWYQETFTKQNAIVHDYYDKAQAIEAFKNWFLKKVEENGEKQAKSVKEAV